MALFYPFTGAVRLIIVSAEWVGSSIQNPLGAALLLMLLSTFLVTLLEYMAGWALEKVFRHKWWDYSDMRWNLQGYVCIEYSLLWGGLALLLTKVLHPLTVRLVAELPAAIVHYGARIALLYLVLDTLCSIGAALKRKLPQLLDRDGNPGLEGIEAFETCVGDLMKHEQVLSMRQYMQHGNTSCLEHSYQVAYYSYNVCKQLGLDYRSAARGGLLHDFFLYDWHTPSAGRKLHAFYHPQVALTNAKRYFQLNKMEQDIILKHMWPLTPALPRYQESYVISLMDKYCTLKEFFAGVKSKVQQLRAS